MLDYIVRMPERLAALLNWFKPGLARPIGDIEKEFEANRLALKAAVQQWRRWG